MISPIKRKTLPEIKVVGLDQEQSLHHFSQKSHGQWENWEQRLDLILCALKEENFPYYDETGDKKKEEDRLCESAISREVGKDR